MICKILRDPTLAECWDTIPSSNIFEFGGENEEERSRIFSSLCDALSKKIESITVSLENVSEEFEGIIFQTLDYAGYDVETNAAAHLVAA